MRRPVRKRYACCMAPGTLPKSIKCYINTPKITSCIDHIKTIEPAPAATNAEKVKFESASEETNFMKYHDEPIPRKKKRKRESKKPKIYQYNADP